MTEIDWTKVETTRGGYPPDDARNMTLRDEFAKAALIGMFSDPRAAGLKEDVLARVAYDYADAMLAERAKRT
jgi:hypothetical protein